MSRSTPCSRTASSFAIRYVPPSSIGLRRSTAMSPPAGERCSVSPEAAGNATTAAVRPSYHHVPPSRMTSEPAAGTALMPTGATPLPGPTTGGLRMTLAGDGLGAGVEGETQIRVARGSASRGLYRTIPTSRPGGRSARPAGNWPPPTRFTHVDDRAQVHLGLLAHRLQDHARRGP